MRHHLFHYLNIYVLDHLFFFLVSILLHRRHLNSNVEKMEREILSNGNFYFGIYLCAVICLCEKGNFYILDNKSYPTFIHIKYNIQFDRIWNRFWSPLLHINKSFVIKTWYWGKRKMKYFGAFVIISIYLKESVHLFCQICHITFY
jgi:hypothetical protein